MNTRLRIDPDQKCICDMMKKLDVLKYIFETLKLHFEDVRHSTINLVTKFNLVTFSPVQKLHIMQLRSWVHARICKALQGISLPNKEQVTPNSLFHNTYFCSTEWCSVCQRVHWAKSKESLQYVHLRWLF